MSNEAAVKLFLSKARIRSRTRTGRLLESGDAPDSNPLVGSGVRQHVNRCLDLSTFLALEEGACPGSTPARGSPHSPPCLCPALGPPAAAAGQRDSAAAASEHHCTSRRQQLALRPVAIAMHSYSHAAMQFADGATLLELRSGLNSEIPLGATMGHCEPVVGLHWLQLLQREKDALRFLASLGATEGKRTLCAWNLASLSGCVVGFTHAWVASGGRVAPHTCTSPWHWRSLPGCCYAGYRHSGPLSTVISVPTTALLFRTFLYR